MISTTLHRSGAMPASFVRDLAGRAIGCFLSASTRGRVLRLAAAAIGLPLLAAFVLALFQTRTGGINATAFGVATGLVALGWLIGAERGPADRIAAPRTDGIMQLRRRNAELEISVAAMQARMARLEAERDRIATQLFLDPLTGAQNRRGLDAAFEAHGTGTVLALLDIDHFKKINDTLGHDAGDRVLKDFTRLLQARLGAGIPVYRIGGEEFVVLFPEGRTADVAATLDGIRTELRSGIFTRSDDGFEVSFSAGLARRETAEQDFGDLYRLADGRLYGAKIAGRGRTNYGAALPCTLVAVAA